MGRRIPLMVFGFTALMSLLAMKAGLDYYNDSASIDALARGNLREFFANQPLMGSLSLVLRAVAIKPVFHAGIDLVYAAGALPCVLALAWLAGVLWRRMAGRSRADRLVVAALCLLSVPAVRAIHWGHPEDVLATAFAVGAVLAAGSERPLAAGLLVGAAAATKQWGVLVGLPALLVLPAGARVRFLLAAVGCFAVWTVPMMAGNWDRFWLVTHAAGSADPTVVLYGVPAGWGAHVNPWTVWMAFGFRAAWSGGDMLFVGPFLTHATHPMMLAAGVLLPALAWLRRRRIDVLTGLRLVALVLLVRCMLDPMSLEYYHLPVVVALAAAAAIGDDRDLDVALLVAAGLGAAFVEPAVDLKGVEHLAWLKFTLYMGVSVPAAAWLASRVYDLPLGFRRLRPLRSAPTW